MQQGYLPMRLVLAARLSRLWDGSTGIETQDEDAREWAELEGHEIVAVAADSKPGPTPMEERPNLKPWVTDPAHMATYDGIVAAKQDRLSRADWSDEARIRLWAEANNKVLFIVDRNLQWPPRNADDRERWNNGAEQARREWENTSKRYRRMQRNLRGQGFHVGQAPWTHKIVKIEDGDHKTLIPHPDRREIAKEMAMQYKSGKSLREIRDWLTASGVPEPRPPKGRKGKGWTAQAVSRILQNPSMIGRIRGQGGKTVMKVEGIIEVDDFNAIQQMLKSRATKSANGDSAMLTSVAICDKGNPMYRHQSGWGLYYYCDVDRCPKGTRLMIPIKEMDDVVNEAVASMAGMKHVIQTVIPGDTYGDEILALKREIAAIDPEDDEWEKRSAELRTEIAALRGRKRKAPKVITKDDTRTVGQVWDSLEPASKRLWLLARRGSGWLPGQDKAKVQCFGRDPETGTLIMDVDLGEYTETIQSLSKL